MCCHLFLEQLNREVMGRSPWLANRDVCSQGEESSVSALLEEGEGKEYSVIVNQNKVRACGQKAKQASKVFVFYRREPGNTTSFFNLDMKHM